MVGAFQPRKDFHLFIRSAIKILNLGWDITFLAIGDGPLRKDCELLVPKQYKDKIIFPGLVYQIEEMISDFSIGVLCTNVNVHGEGVSNVIMEYMALAKPVIATDSGGSAEIVEDGVTGFLIPGSSEKSLIENITYLLNNTQKAKEMGVMGRQRIKDNFSIEQMTHRYLEVYSHLSKQKVSDTAIHTQSKSQVKSQQL
jgi:glycosyltransferase involved in cell wall biosynthesis